MLWAEAYVRSIDDPGGPWSDFARSTVRDWLDVLGAGQPVTEHTTLTLAVLRGALLDLLATGDVERTSAAVQLHLSGGA